MNYKNSIFAIFLLLFIFFNSVICFCQNTNAEITSNNIAEAIRKSDASLLSSHFGNSINLSIPSNDGTFSRTQAEMILREFFRKNPPKSFIIKQQGTSNDGARFTIATYVIQNNKVFRTYYLIKSINGVYLIQLLQFEPE